MTCKGSARSVDFYEQQQECAGVGQSQDFYVKDSIIRLWFHLALIPEKLGSFIDLLKSRLGENWHTLKADFMALNV